MKKRKRLLLGIVISMVLAVTAIVISLSSTQALFSQSNTSTRRNNYNTGILSVTAISKSDTISLNNTLPMTDEQGIAQDPYIFTIKNNGNVDYQFDVQLLSTTANTFDPQYIKIKVDNDSVTTLSALTNSKIKTSLTLAAQQTVDISIRIWLASNTPNTEIGKTFTSELVINGIAVSPTSNYGVTAAAYITNLYNNAAKTVVTNNNIDYNYATSVFLMNDRLGGTTKDLNAGNIRYYGASPNNYIDIGHRTQKASEVGNWTVIPGAPFNTSEGCLEFTSNSNLDDAWAAANSPYSTITQLCSSTTVPAGQPILYRIIGVFDNMLKVISEEDIGGYAWDTSASTVNDGYGVNEWTQSDLMKLLNPGYENDSINNSLYWNSQSGTCYYGQNNGTLSCDFTSIGLTNTVKNKIASVTWHLGAFNDYQGYANTYYGYERGTEHVSNPTDGIARQNTWTGKVGLIYPSDYGYAANFNNCSTTFNTYNSNCTNNNWLYINGDYYTLSSPSDDPDFVWYVSAGGCDALNGNLAYYGLAVRPVFYLNSEVSIGSGTGTNVDPYVLR